MAFDFVSRRLRDFGLELVGRHFIDYAYELQEALRDLWSQATFGIPGGFKDTTPPTVKIGGTPSAGTEDAGWMAANAQLVATRGTPVAIAFTNSTGVSEEAAAADHVHDGTAIVAAAVSESRAFAYFHANIGGR